MFVPWPQNRYVRHLEGRGHGLRTRLSLGAFDPLDPRKLIGTYDGMFLLDLLSLGATYESQLTVLRKFSNAWSAIAFREGGGPWLISWNPWHAETRVRASLMEEVSHIVLGHRPTALRRDPLTGLPKRVYTPSKEKEAYGVAGAALVPYNGLRTMVATGKTVPAIAEQYQVSEQLVQMRLNVTRAGEATEAP